MEYIYTTKVTITKEVIVTVVSERKDLLDREVKAMAENMAEGATETKVWKKEERKAGYVKRHFRTRKDDLRFCGIAYPSSSLMS